MLVILRICRGVRAGPLGNEALSSQLRGRTTSPYPNLPYGSYQSTWDNHKNSEDV